LNQKQKDGKKKISVGGKRSFLKRERERERCDEEPNEEKKIQVSRKEARRKTINQHEG